MILNHFEIVIMEITIRFQTNYQSDIDCLKRVVLCYKNTNNMSYKTGKLI